MLKKFATAASAAVLAASVATPALAETVYMKNGTLMKGRIIKETETDFTLTQGQNLQFVLSKRDIDHFPVPSPMIAFTTGMLVPGAGHVYSSVYDQGGGFARGFIFLGLAAIGGTAAVAAARATDPTLVPVSLLVGAGLPTVLGAFDAWNLASQLNDKLKYRIEYQPE